MFIRSAMHSSEAMRVGLAGMLGEKSYSTLLSPIRLGCADGGEKERRCLDFLARSECK